MQLTETMKEDARYERWNEVVIQLVERNDRVKYGLEQITRQVERAVEECLVDVALTDVELVHDVYQAVQRVGRDEVLRVLNQCQTTKSTNV